jgi:DNA polymerase elongation subunit (family B)
MEDQFFYPYNWNFEEDDEDNISQTYIRIYGLNKDNENVCVKVNDFTPYVYIELPSNIVWDDKKIQLLGNKINNIMKGNEPKQKILTYKYKLYYANIDNKEKKIKFPYLFCSFNSKKSIKILSYRLNREIQIPNIGKFKLKIHEQDASPILQLACCANINMTGWIKFNGKKVSEENKETICKYEYIVRWKNMSSIDDDTIPKPKIMGFDIEVNSSRIHAMPDPKKVDDKIFQISCVICRERDKEKDYKKYLLTLGDYDRNILDKKIICKTFDDEDGLLLEFVKMIKEEQPNIIVGYNILGFDIPYMIDRSNSHARCGYEFAKQSFHKYKESKEKKIQWSSSAYKNQEFRFLDTEGILIIDLLPLVRRDFKLNNYKLKTISEYLLKDTKDDLDAQSIFECYRKGIEHSFDNSGNKIYSKRAKKAISVCGNYCVKDSLLVVNLMHKMQTWTGLCEMAKVCNVPPFYLYTQGQQIKVFSQVYKFCMNIGVVVEKDGYLCKENEKFVGAHVFDPVPGIYDNVVPFDFSSLYPSTIIAYNIDYSTLVDDSKPNNILDEKCNVMEWEDHIYCEHDVKVIRRKELDVIIKNYTDKITLLRKTKNKKNKEQIDNDIEKLNKELKPFREERANIVKNKPKMKICAKRKYRFIKEPKGVLPTVLQNLLEARKNTRNEIKKYKDEISKSTDSNRIKELNILNEVLENRQLAYKVSANSMYGALGVKRGYLPFMPGAMCTTFMGRTNIEKVAQVIQSDYKGKLVYGDTDSNYIQFPHIKDLEELWKYAQKISVEVSKLFPAPNKLEFEEAIYVRFFILTKKRYMYTKYANGKIDKKIGKKGVLLARRDNSKFVRDIYENVVRQIFDYKTEIDIKNFIVEEINKLCYRYYNYDDFIITKAVGNVDDFKPVKVFENNVTKTLIGDYVVKNLPTNIEEKNKEFESKNVTNEYEYYLQLLPAQVQLAEKMKKRGKRIDNGTRLEYVITTNGGHKAKQSVKVEHIDYFKQFSSILKIDYLYYLKLLSNPLDQILNIMFTKDKNFVTNQYKLRISTREKIIKHINDMNKPKLVFN